MYICVRHIYKLGVFHYNCTVCVDMVCHANVYLIMYCYSLIIIIASLLVTFVNQSKYYILT